MRSGESLERKRLKFSLREGKVTALCLQEGEQVWALNIKRALLSMLQTSRMASKQELEKETDVYGTCTSRYERRGPVLLKSRDLKQCHKSRLANFWPHSVSLTEDTSELNCVQRHGSTVMEEVNCTEAVSMATWSGAAGLVKTQTVSTLLLLRAQPGAPSAADVLRPGVLTDLQFEDEGTARPGKARASTPQQASQTVRMLCSLVSDAQLPLLDALPACGSENCIVLLTGLMRNRELEEEQAHAFLTTIALIPHPSPQIITSINALLELPEVRSKALLAGSSLVYQLCQRSQGTCSELSQVQSFIETLGEILKGGCEGEQHTRVKFLYALKSVGNTGLSAPTFIPLLKCFMLGHSTALELRLAAVQAFRRFPCSADRSVLLQLYRSSQEDPEVRIAAYQQLMRCSDQSVFEVVKMTLRNETSSQGMGITNVETSLVFSPKSFLPRSATANLTLYFHGRAHNLLEVDLRVENAEPLLKNLFGHQNFNSDGDSTAQSRKSQRKETKRTRRQTDDDHRAEKEKCLSGTSSYLSQARAMLFGSRRTEENRPTCRLSVKVFGNELSVFTCEDLYKQVDQLSLSMAGLAVKLLKGQEVQLNHRAVLMTDELVLPSLSGLPIKLSINTTFLLSLRLKGNVNYRDTSHFSLTGYIKPEYFHMSTCDRGNNPDPWIQTVPFSRVAYVGLSAMMGVDGALGQAAVDWVSELRSSTSLDGSIQLQEGRDVRVTLNTPEDVMDIVSLSSKVFQISGDHREEIKGPKSQVQRTTCTPKTLSKMVGWQLCSNASYPLPASGPAHFSLRLIKLDRGLHYYLLEAAYSLRPQRDTWLPREASIHLLLATPQSSIPRDMSVDLTFNPHRLLLRITHPLKTIQIQGQLEQERNIRSGKLELLIDGFHYYLMGLVDSQTLLSEQRTRYHLEGKMAADGRPMILSANVTRGLGRKTMFSATVKNVFRETASLSVALEHRREGSSRQYSVEAELLLPNVVGTRMLGLVEKRGPLWSSSIRLKYGLGGDARHLRQECYTSQRLKSERDSNLTYTIRADHELYCSNTAPINHKIHLRHEESRNHIKSSLDMSYGKHWDEINNKRTILLSQSFKNQSTQNHTSYTLEVPENNLNYRTQLLHSHLRQLGSESSTHLKINYNNLMPLVAGLHWKSPPEDTLPKKWEGSLNMDTPWLHIYTSHKLSQHQRHMLQLTSELTASKWLVVRNLMLEGFYRDRGREREARVKLYTQAATYVQAGGWGVVGKRSVKASGSMSSLWTPPLRGDVSLETSKFSHTLQMAATYDKHNVSLTAALSTLEKNLKKRQAMLKMTLSKPKSPSTELHFEGVVEELRKDKKMYQKTAMLQLRQPFQTFPQTLLLRETFTVDLLKGLYILESKAGFHGSREVIHTLTLGYKPPSPFTQKDVLGRLRVGSKEKLTFFGRVQLNPLLSSHQVITFKANFTHQLQLHFPSSAIMEGKVCWNHPKNRDFDYQAEGKLRIERQECQVKATADMVAGTGSSSVHVRADGKDRVKLNAQIYHTFLKGDRAVGLKVNVSQSLLPSATDMHVNMAANMSSDSVSVHGSYTQGHEALLAQVKGSLTESPGLQLAVSGDLRHSIANLAIMPPVLGLDGVLGQSDTLIEGQLRVRVMETVYLVELRHQEAPGDSSDREDEEGTMGNRIHVARIYASSNAQVKWAQEGGRLSVLAELQAGPEHLKAEFNGGKTERASLRWDFFSRLQHRVTVLLESGVSSSLQARAHYQFEGDALDTSLVLHLEDERMVDILINVGSENSTAILVVSLWQQIKLLQGLIPTSLQMNCTGDATAERLSAQCYGNVAGRPVEVRVFRSSRPHNRLCYGLSLAHFHLSAQAKGCYSPSGQKELRANLTHSSLLLLTYLGVPIKSSLRLLLRPGPQRWALGMGLIVDPWRIDLSVALRLERPGLYGWHGLLEFGSRNVKHRGELTGRMILESWCHIWADVIVAWDSITSSLSLSFRCNGLGRLAWVQVSRLDGGISHKTSLTMHGQAGTDGLKASLDLEKEQDSCHCLMSALLRDQKAEVDWTLQHHWASLTSIIPTRVDLRGSGQLTDTSFSGSARVSFGTRCAQINLTAAWEPSSSLRVRLQQNLTTAGVPGELTVGMSTTASQAELELESDVCSVRLLANQHKGRGDRRTSWNVIVHQRCVLLKTLPPAQTSANISITRSGCSTHLSTIFQAEGEQKGSLSLHLTCQPHLGLKASVQHTIEALQMLGCPANGALILNVSTSHLPGVEVGLELGQCYFWGTLGKTEASNMEDQPSYAVNVTHFCPALQGLLSVVPCQLSMTSSLRADSQDLSLELTQACRPPRFSGTLRHSFYGLRSHGVPQMITLEASAPGGPEQAGALFIKAGTCYIRANRDVEAKGRTRWLWALESTCPMLQAHLNGSVWEDPHGNWTATVDTALEGKRGFLRLNARAWPELSVEGELRHNLPALQDLPEHSRLKVTCRLGKHRYDSEVLLQMEECVAAASGTLMSQLGLQGALVYHNNCTSIQEWGSPDQMQSSALLVVSPTHAESQISIVMDETELQASVALKKTKDKSEASLHLNHSVPLLERMGLPVHVAVTMNAGSHGNGSYYYLVDSSAGNQKVELDSAEEKTLTLQSQFGGQQAGMRFKMKYLPITKEIRGTMWHSWSWLQDRGLPLNIEGLCSIQGGFSELRSRARLTVDGHNLLASSLNVTVADGRLALLFSFSPPASSQTGMPHHLDTSLTAQFKGPLRSASVDIHCHDWRMRVVGDVGGWGAHGGSREARVTLKHFVQGRATPALQVEAWGRLTESQLRGSMAVNPELSSSLALIIQGHHLPNRKDLMVKVVHNIPRMMVYLPSQLNVRSQLNQTRSSVAGLVEVLSGRRRLWALGEVAALESGYTQALELKHSYPQLKPLPRTVAVRTVYEFRNWSYQVQHGAVWGGQEFILSGLYSSPPALEMGNQTLKVQINCIPRWTTLEVTLERSLHGRLDSVLLGWTRHGRVEQVRALSWWSRSDEMNETKLELKQPFSSTLSRMSLHTLSHSSQRERRSGHQTSLSWGSSVPVNITVTLNKQWQNNSSRGQTCALFSSQMVSLVKGCVSVGQEGNSYSQNAELRWDNRSVKQGMKYQRGPRGMHSLQVNVGLDRVSPAPCPSHTLLTKIQTNLRDRLEHTVLLGLCPPQPTLSWSGSHRVNSGEELFYTQSRLSVTGRPYQCSLTFALTNSLTAQSSNMSLFSESRIGNWSVEVGGSALSWPGSSGVQLQARLDGREKIWLNGTAEGRCLQTAAGYMNGPGVHEDVSVVACVGRNLSLMLDVQKRGGGSKPQTLGGASASANQRLMLRASGCLESLTALEARLQYLSAQIQNKLLKRIKTLQHLVVEFRRQSRASEWLQELSAVPLHVSQLAETLLEHRGPGVLARWQSSPQRRILTDGLPRLLGLLQHASLLGQLELRRPLATLAGVYQDVKGQRLEVLWRELVSAWTDGLVQVLPLLLENPQLSSLAQASVVTLSVALDVAGQHTYHWVDTRLATALSGVRKRLASVYKFSPSECSVVASVPLPPLPRSRVSEAGLVEILLEEWLLRPLQTFAFIRPTAELYRLQRKIMESPFKHQALLVADQFVVTFDGHLYELPGSCPLLLAQDLSAEPSFTLLRTSDPQNFLLIGMNNSTINIQHNGQVTTNCNNAATHASLGDDGVSVRRGSNVVQVSNRNGATVSCDLSLEMKPDCVKPRGVIEHVSKAARSPVSCDSLFSSPESPLSSCFRVFDVGVKYSEVELLQESNRRSPSGYSLPQDGYNALRSAPLRAVPKEFTVMTKARRVIVAALPSLASAAGWLTISQLLSLIGNQSAADGAGIKAAGGEREDGGVELSRGAGDAHCCHLVKSSQWVTPGKELGHVSLSQGPGKRERKQEKAQQVSAGDLPHDEDEDEIY
ncbi:hypothetical protein EYF80_019960 [Liparis tanakae]|uniref:Vitellogenin domain-containing protein n=1 Tax=Liparis tanakae TaxID=230148 RepID=A0A4Z2HY85_9TELE|nr:hypothetical protein EYF80_019960 [Liparis tanakae]